MGGLLGQIHKQKKAGRQGSGVLSVSTPRSVNTQHTTVISPEDLESVIQSSGSVLPVEKASSVEDILLPETCSSSSDTQRVELDSNDSQTPNARIIRKTKNLEEGEGQKQDLPPWLAPETTSNPQFELLVNLLVRIISQSLGDEDSRADISLLLEKALEQSCRELNSETRLTPKTIAKARESLHSLLFGKGPLEPLFEDDAVTEIFLDGFSSIRVLRLGQLIEAPLAFRSEEEYLLFLRRFVEQGDSSCCNGSLGGGSLGGGSLGGKEGAGQMFEELRLDDKWKTRVYLLKEELTESSETKVCIRIPRAKKVVFYDLIHSKTLPAPLASWLSEAVASREINILVVGERGAGKTHLLTALASAVSSAERVISIEDFPEIALPAVYLERLMVSPLASKRDLVEAALKCVPHRVVLGDVKQGETECFLKILEQGFTGSMTSAFGYSAGDALLRLLDGSLATNAQAETSLIRRISRGVNLVLCLEMIDGRSCLTEVVEVGQGGETEFGLRTLVKYSGVEKGRRCWSILARRSVCIDLLESRGCKLREGPSLKIALAREEDISH